MNDMKRKRRGFSGTPSRAVTKRETDNRLLARKAAAEGFVLLKNEVGFLPLKKGTQIGLYGAGAAKTVKGGTGSGDVNERDSISIWQGLSEAECEVTSSGWLEDYESCYRQAREEWKRRIEKKVSEEGLAFYQAYFSTPFSFPCGAPIEESAGRDGADTAIYVMSRVAGEGADRCEVPGDYYAGEEELALLGQICRYYKNVLLVINAGGPVDLAFTEEFPNIYGILLFVQAGQEGGRAFADVIFGDETPSGKLTDTWALRYQDYPNAASFGRQKNDSLREEYREGIYVGYRYFDTFERPVRYCFGYGLSYTDFRIRRKSIRIEGKKTKAVAVCLTAEVTNMGECFSGKEVVQVYASCPQSGLPKEYRRLAGFQKTKKLAPGESQQLTIKIPLQRLTSYSEEKEAWVLEAGAYGIWIGKSLEETQLAAVLRLETEIVLQRCEKICGKEQPPEQLQADRSRMAVWESAWKQTARDKKLPEVLLLEDDFVCIETDYAAKEPLTGLAGDIVEALSTEERIALAVGAVDEEEGSMLGNAGYTVPGAAGQTSPIACRAPWNVAQIVLADGPAGLRLHQTYRVKDGAVVRDEEAVALERDFFKQETEPEGTAMYQFCTAIPVGTLLAQTWNPALLENLGEKIGGEMELFGITLWLAPGMNIHRNPLGGRNFEYYSEDPLLTGIMAAAMIAGVQKVPGCGVTVKHFACNNQENNRLESDSLVSERALREIYLKGFEVAVREAQPMAVMTSYNMVNGVYAANSFDLCTKVLRREWGFQGTIMTDWMTTILSAAGKCDAAGCMRAGNDLVMPGTKQDCENIREALQRGTLSEEELKRCVYHTVRVILQSNQYENPVSYSAQFDHR